MDYYQKYLKYKSKYINLKEQQGGVLISKEKYNELIEREKQLNKEESELIEKKNKLINNRNLTYNEYLNMLEDKLKIVLKDKLTALDNNKFNNILKKIEGSVERNNTEVIISTNSEILSRFKSIEKHFFIEIDLRNVEAESKKNLLTKEEFCSDFELVKKEVLYYKLEKLENFGFTKYDINHIIILDTEYPIDVLPYCSDQVSVKYLKEKNEENGNIVYNYELKNY